MRLLFLIGIFGLATATEDGFCQSNALSACRSGDLSGLNGCNARYGEIEMTEFGLQSFVNKHIAHSFEYLLLSSHFNNYEKNREGFMKLFKSMADETWNQAIDLIRYISKRGGEMDFSYCRPDDTFLQKAIKNRETYEVYELESLAKAVDIQKSMAREANKIYLMASRDSEVMSHVENTFVHQLSESIRSLSGHANDLKNLLFSSKQPSLHVHLFDDYLAKLY